MNPVYETLEWLVNTPSVTGNEGRIATAIAQRLLPHWSMQSVTRIGNSLVVGEPSGRPMIALYGHTDTVPEQDNGTARVEGDRMFGLGTSDMKAGLAVMIHLLEDDAVRNGAYDVVGVFYDKEEGPADENGLEEVLDRVEWLSGAQLSIVMEPTDLNLELGCNGALNADIIFRGRSAHSARPWLGENAVTKAGAWLAKLHAMEPERAEFEGLEYREVFSVTRAAGGIANRPSTRSNRRRPGSGMWPPKPTTSSSKTGPQPGRCPRATTSSSGSSTSAEHLARPSRDGPMWLGSRPEGSRLSTSGRARSPRRIR